MDDVLKISLAAARVNANMTQEQVASVLKISKRTLINWEKGITKPSFADVNTLANLYKIPVDNIFLPFEFT